ncbi:MAG: hypothetical protein L6Q98_05725 [Anaerolineae bacterium]|nr:hypothetical protein [Anaerolineae bacterium]NUQ03744.1 hypothetical protein [Anaerolineae bacterium]
MQKTLRTVRTIMAMLRRFRRAVLSLCAVGLLIWMGVEDHSAATPVVFGFIFSGLFILHRDGRMLGHRSTEVALILAGSGIGLGTALTAALLMVIKTGWHAHLFPDFPPGMILDVLARAPWWGAAGAFVGLGAALLARWRRR